LSWGAIKHSRLLSTLSLSTHGYHVEDFMRPFSCSSSRDGTGMPWQTPSIHELTKGGYPDPTLRWYIMCVLYCMCLYMCVLHIWMYEDMYSYFLQPTGYFCHSLSCCSLFYVHEGCAVPCPGLTFTHDEEVFFARILLGFSIVSTVMGVFYLAVRTLNPLRRTENPLQAIPLLLCCNSVLLSVSIVITLVCFCILFSLLLVIPRSPPLVPRFHKGPAYRGPHGCVLHQLRGGQKATRWRAVPLSVSHVLLL
jgi:hypothetical protein